MTDDWWYCPHCGAYMAGDQVFCGMCDNFVPLGDDDE